MKFVRQYMIILAISIVGELLHALQPLPDPASIYRPVNFHSKQ